MKLKIILPVILISIVVIAVSCSKSSGGGSADTIASVITQGSWTIHMYLNETKDETANYSGYVFTFNSNGSVSAVKSGVTTTGTWTEVVDSGKRKFILKWNGGGIPVLLLQIEEDWVLKAKSSTLVELLNQTATNNDELHFIKQ